MNRQLKRLIAAIAVVVLGWLAQQAGFDPGSTQKVEAPGTAQTAASALRLEEGAGSSRSSRSDGSRRVEDAFARRESGFMVTLDARVVKNLRDDLEGSRHQRFLIELDSGHTLLVSHNIDLADRIELRENGPVRLRGQYEWNAKGGVIHWTHHDPQGRHPGGWIEAAGRRVE
jgi:hypothetical protein